MPTLGLTNEGSKVTDDQMRGRVGSAVALSALCMAAIGMLLLFAPEEVGA